jgi:predicted nucleic acid-binding protein
MAEALILDTEAINALARVIERGVLAERARENLHAIDAFVAATAAEYDAAVIATGDGDDIRRLATSYRNIIVFSI